MIALETSRDQFRHDFFFSSRNYGGIVIVCKTLSINLNDDDILVKIDPYQFKSYVYQTDVLPPLTNFWDIVHTLPVIHLQDKFYNTHRSIKRISFPLSTLTEGLYDADTLVVIFNIDTFEMWGGEFIMQRFDINEKNYDNDGNVGDNNYLATKTFKLIDESTISNVEEIKSESNIQVGTSKVLTLAYPFKSPLIYFKAGIETIPPTPYLWYKWYLRDESRKKHITDVFRSETSILEENEGEVPEPSDDEDSDGNYEDEEDE
jgi:hypothetical protein